MAGMNASGNPGDERSHAMGMHTEQLAGRTQQVFFRVGGDTGAFSGFMMQRGRMVVCGNAGKNHGDSMYDGTIYVGGTIRDLGVDAVPAELTDLDKAWLTRKLRQYEMLPDKGVDHFTKIVAGKQLWNYDNLEPIEKKPIL